MMQIWEMTNQSSPTTNDSVNEVFREYHWLLSYLITEQTEPRVSLMNVLVGRNPAIATWMSHVGNRSVDEYTLLYRHNLVKTHLETEIFAGLEDHNTDPLLASLLITPVIFGPIRDQVWFDQNPSYIPINRLRFFKPYLLTYLTDLANREDISEDHEMHHHSLLSSFALMILLSRFQIYIYHLQRLHKDPYWDLLFKRVSQTLASLQGVFSHAENRWLCPYVR